jgi:hypothetical protein
MVFRLIMHQLLTDTAEYSQHMALVSNDSSNKSHILHKQTDFSCHMICIRCT